MGLKLLLVCVVSSLHLTEGVAFGDESMGMTQLTQIKSDLEDKLMRGEKVAPEEVDQWNTFKEAFVDVVIPGILSEFEEKGAMLLGLWHNVLLCHENLEYEKNGWQTLSDQKNQYYMEHDTCREQESDPWCNCICRTCKLWAMNLTLDEGQKGEPPSGSILDRNDENRVPVYNNCETPDCWGEFGQPEHAPQLFDWFEKYHEWHCVPFTDCPKGCNETQTLRAAVCWEDCTQACLDSLAVQIAAKDNCNLLQDKFENYLCQLASSIDDDCEEYTDCRERADGFYIQKRDEILALEESLQGEYQIVHTLVCLIDLLVTDSSMSVTNSSIRACGNSMPMSCPETAFCLPEVPGWEEVNCECNNFPNAEECKCSYTENPGWCDTTDCKTRNRAGGYGGDNCTFDDRNPNLHDCDEFEEKYYKNTVWYDKIGLGCDPDDVEPVLTQECTDLRRMMRGCPGGYP